MSSSKWLTEPDEYKWTMSEELKLMAKEELREDEFTRSQALDQMRDWINKNPRIVKCRMDANFLLRFLRFKKFSVPMAEEALERYLLLRQTYAEAFRKLDINNPTMEELVDNGYLFGSPHRDAEGRRVMIGIGSKFDPYKYTNIDMLRSVGIACETLMEDEENQIRGYIHFGDGKGVGFPYLTLFTPREAVRIVKNGERTLPMRHKKGHAVNIHPSLKFAVDFGFSLISEKMRKRVNICTSVEEVYKSLDRKLLPKEYGGDMPMSEMIALWKKELYAHRDILLNNDNLEVRLELFNEQARQGAVSALKNGCGLGGNDVIGIMGSFRKLEVD